MGRVKCRIMGTKMTRKCTRAAAAATEASWRGNQSKVLVRRRRTRRCGREPSRKAAAVSRWTSRASSSTTSTATAFNPRPPPHVPPLPSKTPQLASSGNVDRGFTSRKHWNQKRRGCYQ